MPRKKKFGREILPSKRKGGYRNTPQKKPRYRVYSMLIKGFSPKESKVVHYLSDPVDIRPLDKFCLDEHLPIPECARIMRIDSVQKEVNKRIEENIKTSKALILKRIFAQVQARGTPQAAKLFLEATGAFIPTSRQLIGDGPHPAKDMNDEELDGEIGRLLKELGKRAEGKKWLEAAQRGEVVGRRSDIGIGRRVIKETLTEALHAGEGEDHGSDEKELGDPQGREPNKDESV